MIRCTLTVTCLALGSTLAQSPTNPAKPSQPEATAPGQQPADQATGAQGRQAPTKVVVTAQKWGEQSADDLPRSITPITERLLRDAGIQSIEEAARFVPNALVTGFTARRLSFPFIRGVGSGQGDPAVATFVDDVPQLSVSSTNLSLVGLDRVEIMRGPSGALWGRNTIGGAINLVTKEPEWRQGAELFASFGNFNAMRYEARATAPIHDDLAVSVSASRETRDGYTDNTVTGNDVDYRESTFGRAQVMWAPDDHNTVRFVVYGEGTRDGGFVLSDLDGLRANPYRISQDFEGSTDRNIRAASLTWNYVDDDFEFTSITSAQGWDISESSDFDFSQLDGVRRFTDEEEDYAYQEFRLQSVDDYDPDDRDATGVRWLVGASGFYSDEQRSAANEFRPGGAGIIFAPSMVGTDRSVGDFQSWAASVFGQVSALLGGGFEASGALRYDYEDKQAGINRTFSGFPTAATSESRSFERVLPRASLRYRCCDDVMSYLTIARGFKAGGFNLTAPSGQESFGTETSWTYEFGVKTKWLDDRLHANAAVFYIDWDDMQLSQFDAMAGGFVSNAGQSTSQGAELELVGEVCDCLTLFGTAGYNDTEFDSFTDQFGQNVAGRSLPFAPDWTFGAGAQFRTRVDDDVHAFARVDYFHVGDFYYDAGNLGSESYDLTNLRIGVDWRNWRIDCFLHNAFDEEYVSLAFQANPADPTQFVGQNGAPRTYGLSVRVTF